MPIAAWLNNGEWRSLVARFVRDEEVPGSNPGSPTSPAPRLPTCLDRWIISPAIRLTRCLPSR